MPRLPLPDSLRDEFAADRPIFALFGLYITVSLGISWLSDYFFNPLEFALEFGGATLTLLFLWLILISTITALRTAPDTPVTSTLQQLRSRLTPRLLAGACLIPLLLVFIQCFLAIKTLLPHYFGFNWDPVLADLNRRLHGGTDPWQLLYPWLGSRYILYPLELIYSALWLLAVILFPSLVMLLVDQRPVRQQYFVAYVICWTLLGNVLAGLFLSGGPAFYDIFTGDSARFAGLIAHLREQSSHALSAMSFRDTLLAIYETGRMRQFGGISAMPSMHISMATLFACVSFHIHRGLFAFSLLFLLAMELASVLLSWHYAIDGYASVIITVLVWKLCGLWARRQPA